MTEEKDFQTIATEHGKSCVEDCRQQLDVLATAENGQERLEELRERLAALSLANPHKTMAEVAADIDAFTESEDGQELAKLEALADCDGFGDEERAREAIQEDPRSVEVRSGWCSPGSEDYGKAEEYCLLLGTGGPACRIIGKLDQYGQPESAEYQHQDWFKPWTAANLSSDEEETLREWAAQFWFGE